LRFDQQIKRQEEGPMGCSGSARGGAKILSLDGRE
jgi:hypothetical protein